MNKATVRGLAGVSLCLCLASAAAEIVIQGAVALPEPRMATAAARYQQISGQVAEPEPPTAIVYLEGDFPGARHVDEAPLEVAQQGYQFSPGLLAVQRGTEVAFPNRDNDYHHVFSYSEAKSFDLGRYRMGEEPPTVSFDTPGTVLVGCEIHDHMRGTVLVLDTPYFTRTTPEGEFRLVIPDGVAGSHILKAYIDHRRNFEQQVELSAGATLEVNFSGP